jgi:hypothetical protein
MNPNKGRKTLSFNVVSADMSIDWSLSIHARTSAFLILCSAQAPYSDISRYTPPVQIDRQQFSEAVWKSDKCFTISLCKRQVFFTFRIYAVCVIRTLDKAQAYSYETNPPYRQRCYITTMTARVQLQKKKKTVVVILKGFGPKPNWLAVNRQS